MAITKQQQQNDEKDNGGEFQFYTPEQLTRWEKFRRAIYDPNTNQILGRTPKSWGQLFIFYSIFYMVLAALFAICMQGLFATLDENEPTWTLERSLIGVNPGLGFRPISHRTEEGSLIWYNVTNQTTIQKWVDLADEFLEPYKAPQTGENFVNCNFDKPPGPKQVCITSVDKLGNCHPSKKYGYNSSSPCVFLKLNRIYGWEPEFYTTPEEDMPEGLKQHIKTRQGDEKKQIWVTCNGINDFDKENIRGFNYHPRGFASYYYPYKNLKNYLSPIIGVEIVNVTRKLISITILAFILRCSKSPHRETKVLRFSLSDSRFQLNYDLKEHWKV
nr:unnamed protein product [Callosobruchus analis]